MPEIRRQNVDTKRMIFYALTIVLLVFVFVRFSEVKLLWSLFNGHNLIYLGGIIVLQLFITNYLLALNYRDILLTKNIRPSAWELFPITFVIQFVSQALPSAGISGQVFFIYYLRKFRLGVGEGMSRAIQEVFTLYAAYIFFFVASVAILFKEGIFTSEPRVGYFVYGYLAFISIIIAIVVFSQRKQRSKFIRWVIDKAYHYVTKSDRIKEFLEKREEHVSTALAQLRQSLSWTEIKAGWPYLLRACFWQALWLLSNVMTLWLIGFAIDTPFSFSAALIAYTFAKLISMTSFFPGAPLVFEAAVAWLLITLGVPKDPGIAAGIIYAAFTFWLPMPLGWIWYAKYMKKFEALERDDKVMVS